MAGIQETAEREICSRRSEGSGHRGHQQCQQIRRVCRGTGGSDFHGDNKPGLDLGVGYGKLYVPEEYMENLKKLSFN